MTFQLPLYLIIIDKCFSDLEVVDDIATLTNPSISIAFDRVLLERQHAGKRKRKNR